MTNIHLIYAYDQDDKGYIIETHERDGGYYATVHREDRRDGSRDGDVIYTTLGTYSDPMSAAIEALEWLAEL